MRTPLDTLRIILGALGVLIIITRLGGVIYPDQVRKFARRFSGLKPGWIRFIYLIVGLLGLWILYSSLIYIFSSVPVYLVMLFLTGLILLVTTVFVAHPEWVGEILGGMIVRRGNFFVRALFFLGLLGGIFILLTAIFQDWGG